MRHLKLAVGIILLVSGCYHARVQTGIDRTAPVVAEETIWVHAWIVGLVPPSVVDASEHCPEGSVAREVRTQHGFVHGLVSYLTLGIYTPMQVAISCAREAGETPG